MFQTNRTHPAWRDRRASCWAVGTRRNLNARRCFMAPILTHKSTPYISGLKSGVLRRFSDKRGIRTKLSLVPGDLLLHIASPSRSFLDLCISFDGSGSVQNAKRQNGIKKVQIPVRNREPRRRTGRGGFLAGSTRSFPRSVG